MLNLALFHLVTLLFFPVNLLLAVQDAIKAPKGISLTMRYVLLYLRLRQNKAVRSMHIGAVECESDQCKGLATVVGLTGITLPIYFSVLILPAAFGYGRVKSFAVGAALSSTSLGTVFAVIQTLGGDIGNSKASSSDGDGNSGDSKKEEGKELQQSI
ncbi:unnamed protein product [Tilletia controversa]|uniref:Uncharacterized protein n=3 Tax=Tilletia TaxID=13289 RepID=A0A8X7SUJ5_9BASI|nr:hypothetical protein CF336_g6247 [Tilletia laevis]KAE8190527.1 hypothetical protein CF328_g5950 [Tilletia controversa]KAE8256456.1 hypothetical protein A4X03_0g5386 [Tilletia caries]KAE8193524.1 hypothetical protein CF335_g5564 [Tilletia laevis]KAE8242867.1 hypothetical protein A4X06_0g6716 [Tilletia controversa]